MRDVHTNVCCISCWYSVCVVCAVSIGCWRVTTFGKWRFVFYTNIPYHNWIHSTIQPSAINSISRTYVKLSTTSCSNVVTFVDVSSSLLQKSRLGPVVKTPYHTCYYSFKSPGCRIPSLDKHVFRYCFQVNWRPGPSHSVIRSHCVNQIAFCKLNIILFQFYRFQLGISMLAE